MESFRNRFVQDREFRSIRLTKRGQLFCLSVDGSSIWHCNTLNSLPSTLLLAANDKKFTAIHVIDQDSLGIATFDGEILTFSLSKKEIVAVRKVSQSPVLIVSDGGLSCDSLGRLFLDTLCVLDDGVLQPSNIFFCPNKNRIFFIKHRTVYRLLRDEPTDIQKISLKSPVLGTFFASELVGDQLILATDRGEVFSLHNDSLQFEPFSIVDNNEEENDQDDENEEDENDNENEKSTSAFSQSILAIIKSPHGISLLTVDSTSKHASIKTFPTKTTTATTMNTKEIELNISVCPVECPLCENSLQSLPLNTFRCLNGHPISICSLTRRRIDSTFCFRCRRCASAFSEPLQSCLHCNSLLRSTK